MPPNCGRITQVHLIFNTSASCYMPHATLKTTAAVAASTNDAALSCVCVCVRFFWVTTRETEALCHPTPPSQPLLVASALLQLKCKEITLKNICCACQLAAATLRSTSAYSAHPSHPLPIFLSLCFGCSCGIHFANPIGFLVTSVWLLCAHIAAVLPFHSPHPRSAFPRALRFKFCTRRA